MLAHRDSLERRYDGPIPGADPAPSAAIPAQRARLFQRLAGEAREQAAALRARIGGTAAPRDRRLQRLQRDLAAYRAQEMAWRHL